MEQISAPQGLTEPEPTSTVSTLSSSFSLLVVFSQSGLPGPNTEDVMKCFKMKDLNVQPDRDLDVCSVRILSRLQGEL